MIDRTFEHAMYRHEKGTQAMCNCNPSHAAPTVNVSVTINDAGRRDLPAGYGSDPYRSLLARIDYLTKENTDLATRLETALKDNVTLDTALSKALKENHALTELLNAESRQQVIDALHSIGQQIMDELKAKHPVPTDDMSGDGNENARFVADFLDSEGLSVDGGGTITVVHAINFYVPHEATPSEPA